MATTKDKIPSSSLFFDRARVGAPNKGTNSGLPNPTAGALRKPIGSGGTMSWWCR